MKKIYESSEYSENGCLEWTKSCSSSGYGQFTKKGVYWNTHRYVWTTLMGDIPEGNVIRHLCHNKRCCNIDHLSLGTHSENFNDSLETHILAAEKRRLLWEVDGKMYKTSRDVVERTGISMNSVIKYTCKKTRVFDIASYREASIITRCTPKI